MLELLVGGSDSETSVVDYQDYNDYDRSGDVTFDDAYVNFMEGGGHLAGLPRRQASVVQAGLN